jgi:hypothetical protein
LPPKRQSANVQNATARRGSIANTDITIDTSRTEIEIARGIEIGTGIGIVGIAMKKKMDIDTSAHDTRATMTNIDHGIDIGTSDTKRHQILKKISPFPTKKSRGAKTQSIHQSL